MKFIDALILIDERRRQSVGDIRAREKKKEINRNRRRTPEEIEQTARKKAADIVKKKTLQKNGQDWSKLSGKEKERQSERFRKDIIYKKNVNNVAKELTNKMKSDERQKHQ